MKLSIHNFALSGANNNAFNGLTMATETSNIDSRSDTGGQSSETETGPTLYVEEDYHVKDSIQKADQTIVQSKPVDLRVVFDDVVDIIIEKVMKMGGPVIFMNNGSLKNLEKIALVPSS